MFSLVITTFNRFEWLKRALTSAYRQSLKPDEIIIVNDGSTFSNNEYQQLYSIVPNAKIICTLGSEGGGAARNLGVKYSTKEYVTFLDDDDCLSENYFISVKDLILLGADLCYCKKLVVKDNDLNYVTRCIPAKSGLIYSNNYIGTTSGVTVRKGLIISVGGFDKTLKSYQDYDLWLRIAPKAKVIASNQCHVIYTVFNKPGMQISSKFTNHIDSYHKITEKYPDSQNVANYLRFATAKAIHRKCYLCSLPWTLKALFLGGKLKAIFLLLPYSVFSLLNVYTT